MDEMSVNYHGEDPLSRMVNSAVHMKNYQWALRFNKELTEIKPDKPSYWIDLALSYAYLGQKEKAVETAERVKTFGGEYSKQSELFIQDILEGKYK